MEKSFPSAYSFFSASPLNTIKFFIMVDFCSYKSFKVCSAVSVFSKILFFITSSTLAGDNEIRVSNRPWIFEKPSPLIIVIESIACWLVTITHAFPLQNMPNSSVTVCKLSISFESSPMY